MGVAPGGSAAGAGPGEFGTSDPLRPHPPRTTMTGSGTTHGRNAMMWWDDGSGGGMGGAMVLLMALVGLVVVVAVVVLVVWLLRRTPSAPVPPVVAAASPAPTVPGPHRILDERFARGDIDVEEYRERRTLLDS